MELMKRIDYPRYLQYVAKQEESKAAAVILAGTPYEVLSKYNSTSVLKAQEFADFIFSNKQKLIDECGKNPELTVALYMAGVKFGKDALNESKDKDFIKKTEDALALIHKKRMLAAELATEK